MSLESSVVGSWRSCLSTWGCCLLTLAGSLAAQEAAQPDPSATPPPRVNRLAQETSPYLLMHAHNPVDWRPWNEESLAAAKNENKIIFLSIGYSSCHWCHVMERESFLDEEIAEFVNQHFICIKVDREERPDVDAIYMTALQVYLQLTESRRGGGWPLNMFLTPDGKPFFGGSYFPARDGDRNIPTGFLTVIKKVQEFWTQTPDRIRDDAAAITRYTKIELEGADLADEPRTPPLTSLEEAFQLLTREYDSEHGGFGYSPASPERPKFPEPINLFFLLERLDRLPEDQRPSDPAWEMLQTTLDGMLRGGIHDHVGGGFHRYSVDRYWRIPHFEKMLYDNGQLLAAYARAWQLTGHARYRRACEAIADFALREMLDPEGGFHAALDADSEGEEGKFYRWTRDEIAAVLAPEQFALAAEVFGLDDEPNFDGQWYAPQLSENLPQIAQRKNISEEELSLRLRPIRQALLDARGQRVRPLTDTKVLTAWNGLMIRGLADAGRILENPRYVQAASDAADFLLRSARDPNGRLLRTYGQGQAKLNAYIDDYALLVNGLLALHRATDDRRWLDAADELTALQIEWYWDEARGGFYFTSKDHEALLARGKISTDNVVPPGNAVAALNLIELGRLLNRDSYLEKAERTIQSAAALLEVRPAAALQMLIALSRFHASP